MLIRAFILLSPVFFLIACGTGSNIDSAYKLKESKLRNKRAEWAKLEEKRSEKELSLFN